MSLRYASRLMYQAGMRVMQGMKDHASKYDPAIKSLRDSASSSSSCPSKQARRFSSSLDSAAYKSATKSADKLKQAEESFRTVLYLSCWGPN